MTENDAQVAEDPQVGEDATTPPEQDSGSQEPQGLASLPEWAQEELRRARDEAASSRVKLRETDSQLRSLQESQLEEQQRWQELAETRQGELEEIRPIVKERDALSALMKDQLDDEIASWPESIKAMAPSGDDPLALLEWVKQARTVVREMEKKKAPGNASSPPPSAPSQEPVTPVVSVKSRF